MKKHINNPRIFQQFYSDHVWQMMQSLEMEKGQVKALAKPLKYYKDSWINVKKDGGRDAQKGKEP